MKFEEIQHLKRLLSLPTAPYREHFVKAYCAEFLGIHAVPFFEDAIGNLVVGFSSYEHYKKALRQDAQVSKGEPLKMVIAHMDHPGFHGAKWLSSNRLEILWHGGSPVKNLIEQKMWWAMNADPMAVKRQARIKKVVLNHKKNSLKRAVIELESPPWQRPSKNTGHYSATSSHSVRERARSQIRPGPREIFGAFAFKAPVWQQGQCLYTGGADDIIGVFSILSCAASLWSNRSKLSGARKNFVGLLSRAEEVGFIGTLGHFEKVLPKNRKRELMVLSLEASRTLPGALIGSGPVLRLGDRFSIFDSHYSHALLQTAKSALGSRYQRRIMDGGTCEATPAIAYGHRAVGISVPLGNYHNICCEGAPGARAKMGPAPEFVDIRDVEGQRDFCLAFLRQPLSRTEIYFKSQRADFRKWLRLAQPLLNAAHDGRALT